MLKELRDMWEDMIEMIENAYDSINDSSYAL